MFISSLSTIAKKKEWKGERKEGKKKAERKKGKERKRKLKNPIADQFKPGAIYSYKSTISGH